MAAERTRTSQLSCAKSLFFNYVFNFSIFSPVCKPINVPLESQPTWKRWSSSYLANPGINTPPRIDLLTMTKQAFARNIQIGTEIIKNGPRCGTENGLFRPNPQCHDWGVWASELVRVYEGEAGCLSCPLFFHPALYNYSQSQSSGLTLMWYRHTHTHELEPIDLRMRTRLKHRDALWIQPATLQDSGLNISSCAKIGVQLEVVPRAGECDITLHRNVTIPLEGDHTLHCPDLQHVPNDTHKVTWYYCDSESAQTFLRNLPSFHREVKGNDLVIYMMMEYYAVPYTCLVSYQSSGRIYHFTRTINVKAVSSTRGNKEPNILNPTFGHIYTVTLGSDLELLCRAHLPYLENEEPQVWWTIDNKTVEELADPRYTSPMARLLDDNFGDVTLERVLRVSEFSPAELHREFRCTAKNSRGLSTRTATLQEEVYIPSVELGCGLGVTLALALLLFVLYRVFRLEVHLLYRSWFGTDERDADNKEYDVYISYARDGEEEEFVMTTLRRVLEVDLGYSVCIFDRDSIPGGTITDDTLHFVGRSRRLLVVVSACSAVRGTQALLELQAGLASMLRGGSLRVVLVEYKPVRKQKWVRELRQARLALTLVRWEGEKSVPLSSRFWKRLQLEMPVRRCTAAHHTHHTLHTHESKHTASTQHTYDTKHDGERGHDAADTHHTQLKEFTQMCESTALILDTLHASDMHT
ncbi:interleukin-1 receptor accessory protein isoform X2 [Electrophorus electricus]|uniref:interleukin-1 receptor accessory protein isoform X2 n=1 Tax=Electrophorus electricus TaxID=8005 RepID=UPI0015CFEBF5|nr:interleukin-1 receptor accessory protein isoform X2 [Electrophorus electricus]